VIFQPKVAPLQVRQWYESGYAGGLFFREQQLSDLLQRAVESKPLPRRPPAR
jgi:hypothetical protein